MFQAKDLSEDQVSKLRQWATEGEQLADLQRLLKEEFSLNVTYMDMRFVALDLGLEIKSPEVDAPEEEEKEEIAPTAEVEAQGPPPTIRPVSVTVDQITTPGAMVSGRVSFSDGETGRWMIDQMGRPSLDPDTANYRPTQEDLMAFQGELRRALEQDSTLGL